MEPRVQHQMKMTIGSTIREQRGNPRARQKNRRLAGQAGFSIVELALVSIIVLIVAAMAIPTVLTSVRMADLRGAASDYAGLLEEARIFSIRDNRYYSTYILAPGAGAQAAQAYVDMLPKKLTQASGNGGTSVATGDPTITIESDVSQEPVGSAPNT